MSAKAAKLAASLTSRPVPFASRIFTPLSVTSSASTNSALSSLPAYSITRPSTTERSALALSETPRHAPAAWSPAAVSTTGLAALPFTISFAGS